MKIRSLIMTVILTAAMASTAFAASSDDLQMAVVNAKKEGVQYDVLQDTVESMGASELATNVELPDGDQIISFIIDDVRYYTTAGNSDKMLKAIQKTAITNETEKNTVDEVRETIKNGPISDLFGQADLNGAANLLSGFTPIITLLCGVFSLGAILSISLFTACDVFYLSFPLLHAKMNDVAESGGIWAANRRDGAGVRFTFVTDDAIYAYDKAQESGTQPWTIYLKRRLVAFIMVSIITFVLLTGKITLVVDIALSITNGIIDTLLGWAA